MLESQWFIIAFGNGRSIIDPEMLPPSRREISVEGPHGTLTILHGPSVLVEETDATYSLAVGDTRSLRDLPSFRNTSPERHAVLCVIDKKSQQARVITDRINFSKVFHYAPGPEGFALSTHMRFFTRSAQPLSLTGLACYIANGTGFNNSTVFRDFSVLERASVHEFQGPQKNTTAYWHYGFESHASKGAAKQKLKDSLIESVRDLVCDRPVLVSLSGGFDSSGILGLLAKFVKPQSLKTFSYVLGEPLPGSDALVARQMATLTGYPHSMIQAYDGDISASIRRNAELGEGLSNFSDEVDAWNRLGSSEQDSVVLAGDECFGWSDRRMASTEDVLASVVLRKFDVAATLLPYLDPSVSREMTDGLAADIDNIASRNAQANLHDLKDVLYLEHRLQWALLPWRRFIAGDYFEVREPFLQTKVLEIIKGLPTEDRIGKALYREAIQELLPEIFAIPRARTSQASPVWRNEILRNRAKLEEGLKRPSGLDAVIEPAAIASLLDSLQRGREVRQDWKMRIRRIVGPAAAKLVRSFVRPDAPRFHAPETILIRLLVMREFLTKN